MQVPDVSVALDAGPGPVGGCHIEMTLKGSRDESPRLAIQEHSSVTHTVSFTMCEGSVSWSTEALTVKEIGQILPLKDVVDSITGYYYRWSGRFRIRV